MSLLRRAEAALFGSLAPRNLRRLQKETPYPFRNTVFMERMQNRRSSDGSDAAGGPALGTALPPSPAFAHSPRCCTGRRGKRRVLIRPRTPAAANRFVQEGRSSDSFRFARLPNLGGQWLLRETQGSFRQAANRPKRGTYSSRYCFGFAPNFLFSSPDRVGTNHLSHHKGTIKIEIAAKKRIFLHAIRRQPAGVTVR